MPNAYAYIRFSTLEQAEGDSVDRQTKPLETFTSTTGIEIKEVVIDPGVSSFRGKNVNKGRFKEILDRINDGRISPGDYLVVESIDRITRQRVLDGVELIQGILKKGIFIYTTGDRITYSYIDSNRDLETLLKIGVIAQRANEESETKSRRRRSAWSKAKDEAKKSGKVFNSHNPPYGLRFDPTTSKFIIDDEEANEIRKIFKLLQYTGVSNVVHEINNTSKRKWANRHIAHMIKSQYPLGVLRSQKRNTSEKKEFIEFIENYYPAIVDQVDFNAALGAMSGRRDRRDYGNNSTEHMNIFRNVVKCAKCGNSLLFEKQKNQKGVPYAYLHCYSRKELKMGCDQRFRFDLAFGMLLQYMDAYFAGFLSDVAITQAQPSPKAIAFEKPSKSKHNLISVTALTEPQERLNDKNIKLDSFRVDFTPEVVAARKELASLFNNELANTEADNALKNKIAELESIKGQIGRLTESTDQYERIPKSFVQRILKLEDQAEEVAAMVDRLSQEAAVISQTPSLTGSRHIKQMFCTQEGRLELNKFFLTKKLKFVFEYHISERTLTMKLYKSDLLLTIAKGKFSLHNPLKKYELGNLAELVYGASDI